MSETPKEPRQAPEAHAPETHAPAAVPDDGLDLLGYLAVLWKRKVVVIGLTLVTLATALLLSYMKPITYSSTARVYVNSTALNPPGSVPLASTVNLATEVEIVRSHPVAELAAAELGTAELGAEGRDATAGEVLASTSATYVTDNQVLLVSYSAATAAQAQAGAQAVAEAYLQDREDRALAAAEEAVAKANVQIGDLEGQAAAAAAEAKIAPEGSNAQVAAENLAAQLNGQIAIWRSNIALLNLQAVNPGEILTDAGLPGEPASPNHKQAAARGSVLGLIIGVAAALTIDASHRRRRRMR